jgi:hypothetical protein
MSRTNVGALILCGLGLLGGRPASAQTAGAVPGASAGTAGIAGISSVAPIGTLTPGASAMGSSAQGSLLSNPLAAPLLYNGLMPVPQNQAQANLYYGPTGLATTQMGLMLLANQTANGGIGSGRISGTRTDPRAAKQPTPGASADPRRRASGQPGGLAARYFNRTAKPSAYPQNYYNRRPRYFP